MRILTRYILGEILSHTLIGGALLTFILFLRELPHIMEMIVRNSSTFSNVVQIFLFMLPNTFKATIPMAVLVGVLLGMSRLASDSEIIAMRAGGMGIGYFVRVASIVAVTGTVLGLINSLYLAPKANRAILDLEQTLATSQASYEIQPRIFIEEFHNFVLYVQDVRSGAGAANWRQVFMADLADPTNPRVTTAGSAVVANDSSQELLMRLRDGAVHETVSNMPDQYNISTFSTTDRPLALSQQGSIHLGRMDTNIYAMSLPTLLKAARSGPDARRFRIELHNRFAYPVACLVLMLVGVPLGVASRRGGKSSGFVFMLLLVFFYYFLSSTGIALGRQNKLPAFLAVWSANLIFAAAGGILLWQMSSGGQLLSTLTGWFSRSPKAQSEPGTKPAGFSLSAVLGKIQLPGSRNNRERGVFPRILDEYLVKEFLTVFLLVLSSFVMLMLIFTFFDLVGDILRNHIALSIVGAYLINLTPDLLYNITPLAVLIGVLVTFGVLSRNSELTAMKATGISLYRLIVPILSIAAVIAVSLFLFDEFYLPQANRRQESLRAIIKGRPAQTFLHPDRQWIFGQSRPGEPDRIFYYQFFDSDKDEFANLSIFEIHSSSFQLSRRIFASRVYWDDQNNVWHFQKGWVRDMDGTNVTSFRDFTDMSFAEVHEDPGYFKKENLQSQEMNFEQLQNYIDDLRQSGFDTMRLKVALWHKLAYPLVTVVMAVLAIPFALSMGRRGSLSGIAVAIGVALAYYIIDGLFGAMGNVNYLPAALAAWSSDLLFGLVGGYLILRTQT